ncbi:MAG: hypothetical protein ABW155_14265 [Candidatus Thiodiazotropha sp.]
MPSKIIGKPDVIIGDEIHDYKSGSVYEDTPEGKQIIKQGYIRQLRLYGYLVYEVQGYWPAKGKLHPMLGESVEIDLDPDIDMEPAFALGAAMAALHWLSEGWGYEVTSADVVEAYDRAIDAAARLKKVDEVTGQIRQFIESNESASVLFVRQSLQGRMHVHLSSVNEM